MGNYFRNNSRKKYVKKSRAKNRKNKTRKRFSNKFSKIYKGGDNFITEEELNEIIRNFKFDTTRENDRELLESMNQMIPNLLQLKYNPNYISCFTGKPTRDIYNMISDKLQCFAKYGNDPLSDYSN